MKLDRLLGILIILLQTERVTAPALAARFEVSRRTITRDIDALCMAGIPVVTTQGAGGGIAIAEGFKLRHSVLTRDELSDLIASLKGLGSVTERAQVERVLDKLSPQRGEAIISLQEPILIDLASHAKSSLTEKITQIKRAILDTRRISFTYYYEKGEVRRRIEPSMVLFFWSSWYVFGYCLDREDWRMFKLSRLWDLRTEPEAFVPRPIPEGQMDWNARFPDDKRLIALFDPSEKYQLIDTYGLSCYAVQQDGMLRAEIRYTNDEYMLRWLLGFGGRVRVLAPASIAEGLRAAAAEILANHS